MALFWIFFCMKSKPELLAFNFHSLPLKDPKDLLIFFYLCLLSPLFLSLCLSLFLSLVLILPLCIPNWMVVIRFIFGLLKYLFEHLVESRKIWIEWAVLKYVRSLCQTLFFNFYFNFIYSLPSVVWSGFDYINAQVSLNKFFFLNL